jgi:ornithine decarboxylase
MKHMIPSLDLSTAFCSVNTAQMDFDLPTLVNMTKKGETPIFAISNQMLHQQFNKLVTYLPMVKPHFAIKSLPLQEVVSSLNEAGAYFDVASKHEIDLLKNEGIPANQIIHTHPIKQKSDIEYALAYGITTFVIDNEEELMKFIPYKQRVNLLIRLSIQNPEAQCDLSSKFGVNTMEAMRILMIAKEHEIVVNGCSFHVGSNSFNPEVYINALMICKQLYAKAKELGLGFTRLDIGGGFPCFKNESIYKEENFFEPII